MKILIISYYALPLNAVSSYRIESFCEGFAKEGADVTLLTRHWEESFKNWKDILSSINTPSKVVNENGYRQIFLPYKAKKEFGKYRLFSTLATFKDFLIGNIQAETDTYRNFKGYALELLKKENDFDLILVSAQPLNIIKLGKKLHKKTGVPFIVDIRDYLNNKYLSSVNEITFRDQVINSIISFHVRRWLKCAELVTTVSPILQSVFETKYKKRTILALNGYEQKYYSGMNSLLKKNKEFTIRHIGTIHPGIDFTYIINGIKMFLDLYPSSILKIELIGSHNGEVEKTFEKSLNNNQFSFISDRISKEEAVFKTINSDILLLACNTHIGTYGTKIFDYLASGSFVLLSPPDNSVVEKLIRNYENGAVAHNEEEVFEILLMQYDSWLNDKNKAKINSCQQFSRENVSKKLHKELEKIIGFKK